MKPSPTLWRRTLRRLGRSLEVLSGLSGSSPYAGAQGNRLTMDWVRAPLSPDKAAQGHLAVLRARSRDLQANNAYGAEFIRLVRENIAGARGITMQSKAMTNRQAYDQAVNNEVERAWRAWGRVGSCTRDGKLSWVGLQALVVALVYGDGEAFVRIHRGARGPKVPLQLEVVDADLLDEEFNRSPTRGQAEIRQSIEIDADGRPVAYWILTRHPEDINRDPIRRIDRIRVPASEMLHLFQPLRPGQTRGIPALAPAMFSLRMLGGYQEAAVVAARVAATKLGIITPAPESYTVDGEPPNDGEVTVDAEPGSFWRLMPGETMTPFDPQNPSTSYREFIKGVLQQIASALGVSYAALTADLEGTSYSSGRTGLLQERDHWRSAQTWLIEQFHEPLFTIWMEMAQLTELAHLPARKVEDVIDAVVWQPRGFDWVDPQRDVAAKIEEIKNGLTSRSKVLAERGEDIEDVLDDLAREQALADEKGVKITPAPAPAAAPPGAPVPDAEEDDPDEAEDPEADPEAEAEAEAGDRAMLRLLAAREATPPQITVHPPSVNVYHGQRPMKRKVAFVKTDRGEITGAVVEDMETAEEEVAL